MTRPAGTWVPIALCAFAAKAYTVALLYILSRQTGVREGYEPFVHVPDVDTCRWDEEMAGEG